MNYNRSMADRQPSQEF